MLLNVKGGAWVRIYGIPIHAWNSELFKFAIFECGRFLRLDDSTVAKDRFDYARALLATSSSEIINFSKRILIDGVMVDLKIIEEWGFAIGEDACLLEVAPEIGDKVDNLVNNLADDWATNIDGDECQHLSKILLSDKDEVGNVMVQCDGGLKDASVNVIDVDSIQPTTSNVLKGVVYNMKGEQNFGDHESQQESQKVDNQSCSYLKLTLKKLMIQLIGDILTM
jgi:hypothetical protein